MKIRQGFVSNSSSSSFLVYGFMFKNGDEDYDLYDEIEKLYKDDEDIWNYVRMLDDEENYVIGYEIASTEGTEEVDINLDNLEHKKQEVINLFKEKRIDFSDRKFNFILGEMYG